MGTKWIGRRLRLVLPCVVALPHFIRPIIRPSGPNSLPCDNVLASPSVIWLPDLVCGIPGWEKVSRESAEWTCSNYLLGAAPVEKTRPRSLPDWISKYAARGLINELRVIRQVETKGLFRPSTNAGQNSGVIHIKTPLSSSVEVV